MASRRDIALGDILLAEPAAKVLRSMKEHWTGLTVFVKRPWVPMDNNVAERDARLAVVGRKNFYGSASLWSGQLAATMYSLLMTAKLWSSIRALAGRVPPGLRRQWRSRAAGARAVSSWAMGATRLAALRAHATVCTVPAQAFDTS